MAEEASAEARAENRKVAIVVGVGAVGIFVLLEMLGWFERGGVFSIAVALRAVNAHAPSIDIDGAALRFPMLIAMSCLGAGVCAWSGVDISKRAVYYPVAFFIVIGGYALNGIYGHQITGQFMTTHGYSRCPAGDHDVGRGKGRVWFENYVLATARCPVPHTKP
jgi:hypothetical protein